MPLPIWEQQKVWENNRGVKRKVQKASHIKQKKPQVLYSIFFAFL